MTRYRWWRHKKKVDVDSKVFWREETYGDYRLVVSDGLLFSEHNEAETTSVEAGPALTSETIRDGYNQIIDNIGNTSWQ